MLWFNTKDKASMIENKSLLNEIYGFEENDHNIIKFDIPCEKHVIDFEEKNALIDCWEEDKLIKLLKENELNTMQELGKARESIKKLTIGAS